MSQPPAGEYPPRFTDGLGEEADMLRTTGCAASTGAKSLRVLLRGSRCNASFSVYGTSCAATRRSSAVATDVALLRPSRGSFASNTRKELPVSRLSRRGAGVWLSATSASIACISATVTMS